MGIREVQKTDIKSWANLRNQLWPYHINTHINELQDFFKGCSNDIVKVYVAEDSGKNVVGFIELNLRNFAEGSRSRFVPYIEGWFVAASFQNQGIGKMLIGAAEIWARECGFNELASDTELENKKSIGIHKGLGFKEVERVVCFIKKLDT